MRTEDIRSNFAHPFPYVVQAQLSGFGWADTKHGGTTPREAREAQERLLADDGAWMPGRRETRIAKALKIRKP